MTLFSADLFRNFGIGFVAGALIVGVAGFGEWGEVLESPAQAAKPVEVPAPSSEFQIEPFETSR